MVTSKRVLYHLKELHKHLVFYNTMAPFPIYDTEYVNNVGKTIKKMKKEKVNYDELPVYFCKHCKSLYIETDSDNNEICNRCGAVNEVDVLPSIKDYDKKYGEIWK